MKNNTVTVIAITGIVLATLLLTTTSVLSLTNQVSAEEDRENSFDPTVVQSCKNGPHGGNCQNVLIQLNGRDNPGTVQPLESDS
jgi:cell division protein FtsX